MKNKITINYNGTEVNCLKGENLRTALIRNGLSPHNGKAKIMNCRGIGTCGTCAVQIKGSTGTGMSKKEACRLALPPHKKRPEFRLACQCRVQDTMDVIKHPGFWGER